ncbi:hypothetical protein ACFX13_028742 [Malus domestica]
MRKLDEVPEARPVNRGRRFVVKDKALVAEMARREGLNLWQELFPTLVSLSYKGPIQAELVSMTLRWLPEDITVHNEDLEGDRRRLLLRGLTQSLPEILPLLYTLLERHFGAALSEAGKQQFDLAKQHGWAENERGDQEKQMGGVRKVFILAQVFKHL